jgi:hypothetical protein
VEELESCIFLKFKMHLNFSTGEKKKCAKCVSYIQSNIVYGRTVEGKCTVQVNVKRNQYMGPLSLVLSRETTSTHNR